MAISEELSSSSSPPIQLISPLIVEDPRFLMESRGRLPRVNMAKEFVKGLRWCNSENGLAGLLRDYSRYLDIQAITALGSYLSDAASGKREFTSSRSTLLGYARAEWIPLLMENIHQMDHIGLSICIQSIVKISTLEPSRALLDEDNFIRLLRAVDENMHLCSPRSAVQTLGGLWRLGSDAGLSNPLPLPWVTRFLACALPNALLALSSPQDLAVLLRCLAKIRQHQFRAYKAQKLHEREQGYFSTAASPKYPFSRRWAVNLIAVLGRKAPDMNLREVGTASWSVATMGLDPGPNVLNVLWKQAELLLLQPGQSFSSASLGGLCYCLCVTSHPPPSSLLAAIKRATSPTDPSANSCLDVINDRDLMLLLMALGRWSPEVDPRWKQSASDSFRRCILSSCCSSASIAGILHAMAQLGIRPSMEVMHQAENRLLFLRHSTCPPVSARILIAFGSLGYLPRSSLGSFLVSQMVDHMDQIAAKKFFPALLALIKLRLPISEPQLMSLIVGPQKGKYEHVRETRNFIQHAQFMAVAWKLLMRKLNHSLDWQGKLRAPAARLIQAATSPDNSEKDLAEIRNLLSFIHDNQNCISKQAF